MSLGERRKDRGWGKNGGGKKNTHTNQYEEFHYAGILEGGRLTGMPNKKDWE